MKFNFTFLNYCFPACVPHRDRDLNLIWSERMREETRRAEERSKLIKGNRNTQVDGAKNKNLLITKEEFVEKLKEIVWRKVENEKHSIGKPINKKRKLINKFYDERLTELLIEEPEKPSKKLLKQKSSFSIGKARLEFCERVRCGYELVEEFNGSQKVFKLFWASRKHSSLKGMKSCNNFELILKLSQSLKLNFSVKFYGTERVSRIWKWKLT